jgi:nucleoside-diphosphate-sugar epimerase
MRRCLVTGATGAVGPRLLQALHDGGWGIRVLARHPDRSAIAVPGAELLRGDITDAASLAPAMDGIDTVFHLASLLHVVNPPPSLRAEYERVNVAGTANVVNAARSAGVRRLVFFSTIAVYGAYRGRPFGEEDPCEPETDYGRTKLEAERVVLGDTRADGPPLGTVLRLAAVYGPGIKGNYARLVRAVARGRFVGVGPGENRRALVHDRDVARAALLAAEQHAAAGKVYNVADDQPHRLREIIEAIAAGLGRTPPRWHVPLGPALGLAGLAERVSAALGMTPPIRRATIEKYVEDVVVDAARIGRELGFTPQVDLRAGWADTAAGMRASGAL